MRRVAFTPVLLVLAAVASSASVATTGVRVQTKDRITSAANLPTAVKRLSPKRSAAQPMPTFNQDPTPIITEFYGPSSANPEAKKSQTAPPSAPPEAAAFERTSNSSR